jgi:hypothetical protein
VFAEDPRLGPGARGWWRRRVSGLTALAFIEDRATLPGGFTLTPGLAFVAADVSRGDEQVLAGSAVTPGLGAAWDATRDGLTVVRAGVHRRADLDVERVARSVRRARRGPGRRPRLLAGGTADPTLPPGHRAAVLDVFSAEDLNE